MLAPSTVENSGLDPSFDASSLVISVVTVELGLLCTFDWVGRKLDMDV